MLGETPSIETPAQGRRWASISAGHVQTVIGLRGPLTGRPVAQEQAGVGALPACAGRWLYTP